MIMRDLTKLEESAIEDLENKCLSEGIGYSRIVEMVNTMTGLLKKDMVEVNRMESGEYFWKSTEKGVNYVNKH